MKKKAFIKFLKENDILIPFVCNLAYGRGAGFGGRKQSISLSEHLNSHPTGQWVNCSFSWKHTSEGHEFWEIVYNDWDRYVRRGYMTVAEAHHKRYGVHHSTSPCLT